MRPHITFAALASICVASTSVFACEIRVRDSAFRTVRDVHKLCVIADAADQSAQLIQQRLNQWLDRTDGTLNLEIVRINADDPETNWQSVGIPSAPPELPVTVLVGRDNGYGDSFLIDHWEPAPTAEEFAAIVDSPVRAQLAGELASNVAVLIFAPTNPVSNSSVANAINSIVEAGIADERIGLSLIWLDRNDPAEKLLCRFMGIRSDSPDTLCVAFGRGKLMTPPLIGDEITAENINKLVTQIRQACSCSKPLPTMGVDVPLVWSDAVDSTVILMDQEIELAELETEVQNMLAAKATGDVNANPVQVPIAPGQSSAQLVPVSLPVAEVTRGRFVAIAVGLAVCAIAISAYLSRYRVRH